MEIERQVAQLLAELRGETPQDGYDLGAGTNQHQDDGVGEDPGSDQGSQPGNVQRGCEVSTRYIPARMLKSSAPRFFGPEKFRQWVREFSNYAQYNRFEDALHRITPVPVGRFRDSQLLDMGFDRDIIDEAREAWYSLLAVPNEEFNGVVMKHDAPSTAFAALFEHYLPLSDIRVRSMYMELNSIKLRKGRSPLSLGRMHEACECP